MSLPEKKCSCCGENIIFQYMAYPLDYCLDKKFNIYKCTHCGHGITDNVEESDSASLYEGGAYDPQENIWHRILRPVLNVFESAKIGYLNKYPKEGNLLLEIGTGKGNFLRAAINAGYDGYGIEPSTRSYKIAKLKLGKKVVQCMLEEMHLHKELNKKFDFIILWHVLEHLTEPENAIRILKSFLKPDGILIIAVPNFDSYQSSFGKSNWYHLDPPRHLSHFTPSSTGIFLEKNAMQVKKIFYNSFLQNMIGDIITINNLVWPHKNILLNVLRFNNFYFEKKSTASRVLNLFAFTFFTAVALLPCICITLFSALLKKSGTMVILAENISSSKHS